MNATVFDVRGWTLVGLVELNTAVNECEPECRTQMGPMVMPAMTGIGSPRLVLPS